MDTDRATLDDLATLRSAFENGTPLGWEAVRAFEEQQGIVLPEPYRTFVAEITDGATAGPPDYGLVKLGSPPPAWQERDLTKPFPLTEAWVWEGERPDEELRPLLEPVYNHGSLLLGTDGCAMYWHLLIVTGPHRGHVWHIADVGAHPFGAEFGYTTARSGFAGWVRHWSRAKTGSTRCQKCQGNSSRLESRSRPALLTSLTVNLPDIEAQALALATAGIGPTLTNMIVTGKVSSLG